MNIPSTVIVAGLGVVAVGTLMCALIPKETSAEETSFVGKLKREDKGEER